MRRHSRPNDVAARGSWRVVFAPFHWQRELCGGPHIGKRFFVFIGEKWSPVFDPFLVRFASGLGLVMGVGSGLRPYFDLGRKWFLACKRERPTGPKICATRSVGELMPPQKL